MNIIIRFILMDELDMNQWTAAICCTFVQLMPGRYKDIDIMIDYSKGQVMKLGELTPEWWID